MQWTLINWKRKDLPVVLSLKEVEFLFDTIAGVRHGKFKRLTRRLVRGLREREKHDFLNSSSGERGCHISEACSSITTISTRIFTYSMSTLVHVGPQSLLLIGRRTNTTQNNFPQYCSNKLFQHSSLKYSTIISIHRGTVVHATLLQCVAPLQIADRVHTLNKFTLVLESKGFSAASGERFPTLRVETRRQVLNKYRLEIDTANWHDKRGTRSTNIEHHNTLGGTPYMESV